MQRITTPINGITTTSTYQDGDCYSLVNLRPKNGALHPVPPRKTIARLSYKYDIVFVHKNNDYENWIGIINNGDSAGVYTDILQTVSCGVTGVVNIIAGDKYTAPNGAVFIIKEIDITNGSGKIRLQPDEDSTVWEIPEANGSLSLEEGTGQSVISYTGLLAEDHKIIQTDIPGNITAVEQIGNTLSLITPDTIYYILYESGKYKFLGILPDLPVVNFKTDMPIDTENSNNPDNPNCYKEFKTYYWEVFGRDHYIIPTAFIEATKAVLYRARDKAHEENGSYFFDAFFIRYAFRLYDGSLTKHSPPILVMPPEDITKMMFTKYRFYEGHLNGKDNLGDHYAYIKAFLVKMWYNLKGMENWNEIIQSVDFFVSPYMSISTPENIRTNINTEETKEKFQEAWIIEKLTSAHLAAVKDNSTFYYAGKIELGDEVYKDYAVTFPEESLDPKFMDNLVHREAMTDDNFSHHLYGASLSYVYNNRLHIANTKTTFFKGFNMGFFQWYNACNAVEPPQGLIDGMVAEVEIQTGTHTGKVYSAYDNDPKCRQFFASSFISYPDTRAKKITIYEVKESIWTQVRSLSLTPHPFLNLAYYVDKDLKPIIGDYNLPPLSEIPESNLIISLSEPNKIKVSELNNPIVFPNLNTYQVSNGKVLALASNIMNVSDWNYGQYPLYVFTSEGIWTLNVGEGEVVYSNLSSPTYYEAPSTDKIASTPYGVLFTTKRGLCIINGQQVDFISPQLEQEPKQLVLELPANSSRLIQNINPIPFSVFIKNLDKILYNPNENEVILSAFNSGFNYVLNMSSMLFYQSTESFDLDVKNIYPDFQVSKGNLLKDYSKAEIIINGNKKEPVAADVSFIFRPLLFGSPDHKKLERMILRSTLYNKDKLVFMAQSSDDGLNFSCTKGAILKAGNYKDLDTGLIVRNKFRHYLYIFGGTLDMESRINMLESVVANEYQNEKMR